MPNKNSFITEEGKLNGKNSKHMFSLTESNPKITVSFSKEKGLVIRHFFLEKLDCYFWVIEI